MRRPLSPQRLLLLSFAFLIAGGTLLLAAPFSSASGKATPVVDALFTATSSVCVTGLVVVDTGSAWSPFGQGVILTLLQLGGLGILTFSTFLLLALGRRLSFSQHTLVMSGASPLRRADTMLVLRRILIFTFALEGLGALLLWLCWRGELGGAAAAWHAAFHAISAFCNAGFSTFPRSLEPYRADLAVNAVIMGLIVLGGIGFVVLIDLENRFRFRTRLSLHTKIVLSVSLALILGGALVFYVCEAHNSLQGLPVGEQALASLFAAVTARTAGFNTLDYGTITTAGLVLTVMLMIVGGSPGSTAGGIKTTTLAVLLAQARSSLRGGTRAEIFDRSVPAVAVRQAQALVLLAVAIVGLAPFVLEFTEVWAVPFRDSARRYLELWFEAVSAFGTVGLSTGITSSLSMGGKLILVVLMFVGRVGLLTVVMAVARRRVRAFHPAQEDVLVG